MDPLLLSLLFSPALDLYLTPSFYAASTPYHTLSGYFVQCALGIIAFLSLVLKRNCEKPRRRWKTFFRDASKQAFGAGVAHVLNMVLAIVLNGSGNECKWYFIIYIVDNVVGVLLNLVVLLAIEKVASKYTDRLKSGVYVTGDGHNPHTTWCLQLTLWLLVVILVKLIIFFAIVIPLKGPLYDGGDYLLQGLDEYPRLELVFVMIIVPTIVNTLQFWIQDNFLMNADGNSILGSWSAEAGWQQVPTNEFESEDEFDDDGVPIVQGDVSETLWERKQRRNIQHL